MSRTSSRILLAAAAALFLFGAYQLADVLRARGGDAPAPAATATAPARTDAPAPAVHVGGAPVEAAAPIPTIPTAAATTAAAPAIAPPPETPELAGPAPGDDTGAIELQQLLAWRSQLETLEASGTSKPGELDEARARVAALEAWAAQAGVTDDEMAAARAEREAILATASPDDRDDIRRAGGRR